MSRIILAVGSKKPGIGQSPPHKFRQRHASLRCRADQRAMIRGGEADAVGRFAERIGLAEGDRR